MSTQVSVSKFRAELRRWLERVRDGEEVVVTERGVAVARVLGADAEPAIQRLVREGLVTLPTQPKGVKAGDREGVPAQAPVSEIVSEQRD